MSVRETPADLHALFHHDGDALDEAVRRAVHRALRRHARAGRRVAESDGAGVSWVAPDELSRRLDAFRC